MDEPQTCGKGLAERSELPANLAAFIDALAGLLEQHQKSVTSDDASSAREREAYRSLAAKYRDIARDLDATAKEMAGYRAMPMAPHDVMVLISAANISAFEKVVVAERAIAGALSTMLIRDEEILRSMRDSQSA
jgi:hypothetical protein